MVTDTAKTETAKGDTEKPADEEKPDEAKKEARKPKHPVIWVSNVSRHIKATDLKKHFSQHGKVVTAKIVTNGKSFFGYVCLDSIEAAENCVKLLNDSEFEGKKISVSLDKPDRDERIKIRQKPEADLVPGKDPLTTTYDDAGKPEDKDDKKRQHKRTKDSSKMSVDDLRREVANCEREIDRLRNRLIEEQARCRTEVVRARRLERDLADAESKIREDRKRFDRDREDILKKNRLEQLRLEADRVIVERDRKDLMVQREQFERDLRRFVEEQQRASDR